MVADTHRDAHPIDQRPDVGNMRIVHDERHDGGFVVGVADDVQAVNLR